MRNTRTRYSDDVAKVLGKAFLWLIFSPDGDYLPQTLQDRVKTAYNKIAELAAGENPVKKIALVVSGNEGELYLDEIGEDFGGAQAGRGHRRAANKPEELLALKSQVFLAVLLMRFGQ